MADNQPQRKSGRQKTPSKRFIDSADLNAIDASWKKLKREKVEKNPFYIDENDSAHEREKFTRTMAISRAMRPEAAGCSSKVARLCGGDVP